MQRSFVQRCIRYIAFFNLFYTNTFFKDCVADYPNSSGWTPQASKTTVIGSAPSVVPKAWIT